MRFAARLGSTWLALLVLSGCELIVDFDRSKAVEDAGPTPDNGGTRDASQPNGPMPDAGGPDAGAPDAGQPRDSGDSLDDDAGV